jgi:hypothetical protein
LPWFVVLPQSHSTINPHAMGASAMMWLDPVILLRGG